MLPKELLAALMKRAGLNATQLAKQSGTKQPQIHRFLNGDVKEPRRSTWSPVAKFFSVPVEAFFDPKVAARVAAECGLTGPVLVATEPEVPRYVTGMTLAQVVRELAGHLATLAEPDRPAAGALLDSLARSGGSEMYQDLVVRLLTGQHAKQRTG